jgi:hypothetical protein
VLLVVMVVLYAYVRDAQLSEVHPSCLMLNFAIQRISDAGHQTEIASLATASTNFGVFNRVLSHSLLQLAEKVKPHFPSHAATLCM